MKAKVDDLFTGRLWDLEGEGHYLYVVSDGNVIFYVGKSRRGITNRLLDHLGQGQFPTSPSSLGRLIIANLPESLGWTIELIEPRYKTFIPPISDEQWAEMPAAAQFFAAKSGFEFYSEIDIGRTEVELIVELHPCLNVTHNLNPSSLPSRYKDCYQVNLDMAAGDFVPF